MDFTILEQSEGSALIENSGNTYLAIETGLKNRAFAGVDTSRLKSLPGLIVKNNEIHNWNLEGVTEIDGKNYYYGPSLKGKTLASSEITSLTLKNLAEALYVIKDRNFPIREFSLTSVFLCNNGDILFFPPKLMEFLNNHRLRQNSLKMVVPWNKPGLEGDKAKAFTLAALVYFNITGIHPFDGVDEEEIEKLMSSKNYPSPLLIEPRLIQEFVELLDQSFKGESTLAQWRLMFKIWLDSGIVNNNLNEQDLDAIKDKQEKREKKRLKSLKRAFFLRKNRNRILVTGAVIAVLGMIIQAPLSKYLAAPVTIGMSQKEVVALYYNCFKTLDTETLDDTIIAKAGKADINEISTVFVTSRVRTSYEGSTGLLDPEDWIASGMNPVPPGTQVWGISDLSIQSLGNDMYEADYIKWTPAAFDDLESNDPLMPINSKIKDILHLSYIKDAWIIDQIKRIKE